MDRSYGQNGISLQAEKWAPGSLHLYSHSRCSGRRAAGHHKPPVAADIQEPPSFPVALRKAFPTASPLERRRGLESGQGLSPISQLQALELVASSL